jgi:hypothetical protein
MMSAWKKSAEEGKKALGRELTDIPFEGWITYVFDHPVPDPGIPEWAGSAEAVIYRHWYLESDSDWWDPSAHRC